METVFEVVTETGVLHGKHRRAVDSTALDDAVARQDTITQLIAAIRRFGRDLPDGATMLAIHATGYDYSRSGKPEIAWDDKEALISLLVNDALSLLEVVDPKSLEPRAGESYALLALVAGQDVEPAEGSAIRPTDPGTCSRP